MVINKEREVEPLRDFNEETYKQALKDGNLNEYENEIEMTYEVLNIPNEIMELPKQAQSMLYFYCDRQFRNPETGNKTYNDLFESYIASLEDKSIIENVYKVETVYDENNQPIDEKVVVDPKALVTYNRLKTKAMSLWREFNIEPIVPIFKKTMLGGRKQEDMLKEDILDDALFSNDVKLKVKSRDQAIKILGMDKNVQMQQANIWKLSGGKELGKKIAETTGVKSYDNSHLLEDDDDV